MIISHKNKFIFIHIPKTGGSSLTYNIRHVIDSPNEIQNIEIKKGWQALLHIDGDQHSNYKDNVALCEKYKTYFKFVFVRNPWDLALSWYLALSRNHPDRISPQNFKKFLFDQVQHHNPIINPIKFLKKNMCKYNKFIDRTQFSYISDKSGNIAVDYVARFENFEHEFKYIVTTLNITDYEYKKQNVANVAGIKYQDFYDDEGRNLIAKLYREDTDMFGYTF